MAVRVRGDRAQQVVRQAGRPPLWEDLMDELREARLGIPRPDPSRPRASQLLQEAYGRALATSTG